MGAPVLCGGEMCRVGLLELLGDGGGDGVAVHADADGLGHEVGHRDVQVTVVQLVGVPRVLYLVVFVALLVGGGSNNHHAVVVGGLEVVETGLTALLRHFLLLDRALDLEFFVLTVFVAQLDPTAKFGIRHVLTALGSGEKGISLAPFESAFRYVGRPAYRAPLLQCVVHDGLHVRHRHVARQRPGPVVGNLKSAFLVEGMMREADYVDEILRLQPDGLGERLRRIGFALVGELLGYGPR